MQLGQANRFRAGAGVLMLLVSACHGSGLFFQGRSRPPVQLPDAIIEGPALPRGASKLGRLVARCQEVGRWDSFQGLALVDVDCTEQRLRLMLKEAASRLGGDVLFEVQCRGSGSLLCQAFLGRMAGGSDRRVERLNWRGDIRGELGSGIRVDFESMLPSASRPRSQEASVRELPVLPPSHRLIGSFSTSCEECSQLEARDAVRIAAAGLGASDLVGVRCLVWGAGYRCVGSAAEVEP